MLLYLEKQIDRKKDGKIYVQKEGQIDKKKKFIDSQNARQKYRKIDKIQIDRKIDRIQIVRKIKMERWKDRYKDRQI